VGFSDRLFLSLSDVVYATHKRRCETQCHEVSDMSICGLCSRHYSDYLTPPLHPNVLMHSSSTLLFQMCLLQRLSRFEEGMSKCTDRAN
jgi:hypothetical protein